MCKYGIKTENARFGMRAAIAKRFSGDAAPERLRFFRISVGFSCRACACLGARERSERVTGRLRRPRQLCRRLVQHKHTSRSHTRIFTAYRPNKRRRETFPKRCVPLFGYDYSQAG